METIPTISDAELTVTISKRYHGDWEVTFYYSGVPVKRYPLNEVISILIKSIWWVSFRPMVRFNLTAFINKIKMDVINSIWENK
jgi:uncharacterized membrane protein